MILTVDPNERRKRAMDAIRDGRTAVIDIDYLDETVEVHAEMGDVLYTFYLTRADGTTKEIEGMVVRKLLIEQEFHLRESGTEQESI